MLELVALVLGLVAMATSFSSLAKWCSFWRDMEKLPGYSSLPLLGTTYKLMFTKREDLIRKGDEDIRKFWPIFRSWWGRAPAVELVKPEHVEKIMSSNEILEKVLPYTFLYPWLGRGLLTSEGVKWHSHRKMITPAFHFRILDNFVEIFAEKSEILVKQLKSKADGKPFDIYPFVTRCTLDIICETAMGTQINAQEDKDSSYVTAVYNTSELTIKRLMKVWLHNDFLFKMSSLGKEYYKNLDILHGFTTKVIRERKQTRKTIGGVTESQQDELGRKRRVAFLDVLLDASEGGQKMTEKEVQEEVDTFMFEGHDTTSVAIAWVLTLLGHHPDVQDKVYTELRDIFEDNPKRHPSTQDLNNMKYLEMVIKETLRLYPSVPVISRMARKDLVIDGYKIPAGCNVIMHIRHIHRDPEHWPDPERFDPDRFLPENANGRHPYAFVPFSAGPRNCIGQKFAILEEKAVLSYVLRNFRVQSVESLRDLKLVGELVLRPINGVILKLTPR